MTPRLVLAPLLLAATLAGCATGSSTRSGETPYERCSARQSPGAPGAGETGVFVYLFCLESP